MLAWFLVGCSGFQERWNRALAEPQPGDFTGAWQGRWVSEKTGHEGKLKCVVEPSAEASGRYAFHYWARWAFLSGAFSVEHPVRATGKSRWSFSGDSDLGIFGGLYQHEGEATEDRFQSRYRAAHGDRGFMEMTRPAPVLAPEIR